MTTILTCTTPEYVVLASDRAVSYNTARGIEGSPDRMGKTIALYGQFLMGVTGFAELDGLPMDEWVIERLSGVHPQKWPQTIADRATASIGKMRKSSSHKHHSFVGVGFARIGPDPASEWLPWRFVISNAYDKVGAWLNQAATRFTVAFSPHPPEKWADLNSYGQTLPSRVNTWAERALRNYQQRNEGAAQGCVELLGRLVSGVARRTSTVSTACLVSVLPKAAAGTGNVDVPIGTGSYVSKDAITCLNYIGTENQVIAYMPAIVFPGESAIAKRGMFAPQAVVPPKPFENRPRR